MADVKDVTLYYFPGSYYSFKVLHALYEKGVPFKERLVFIVIGEQNKDWFLKKNDKGEVPVLEIDGQCYSESENIIDVIDKTFKSGPRLVPDLQTTEGREVQAFRKLLHDITVDVISYGIFANRHFCVDKEKIEAMPAWVVSREAINRRFSGEVTHLIRISERCDAEMKVAMDKKIVKVSRKLADLLDVEIVGKRLDELENIFDKISERLEKSKREQGSGDVWLFGSTFNAADITAIALMLRLNFLGVAPRYFSIDVRPIVFDYYTRALQKESVGKIVDMIAGMEGVLKSRLLKIYGKKVLKISLFTCLLTAGYFGLKKFFKA